MPQRIPAFPANLREQLHSSPLVLSKGLLHPITEILKTSNRKLAKLEDQKKFLLH